MLVNSTSRTGDLRVSVQEGFGFGGVCDERTHLCLYFLCKRIDPGDQPVDLVIRCRRRNQHHHVKRRDQQPAIDQIQVQDLIEQIIFASAARISAAFFGGAGANTISARAPAETTLQGSARL